MANGVTMFSTDRFLESGLGLFLDSHRVTEKGDPCSFTGMGTMRGKFMVKDDDYPHFLDLLHEYLFTQQRRPLNLVEQRRCDLQTPILIDLDFKYPIERAIQRQFEISHVHAFLHEYVSNLTHFYDLSEHRPLRFFITMRPAPYEDKKSSLQRAIKDGVHIQCPDLVLTSEHQQVLRHRSLERKQLAAAFQNTGYINAEKDIFDEAIVKKNGWFFYGESKPDIPAYSVVSVYVYDPRTQTFEEEDASQYSTRALVELLSIRYQVRIAPLTMEEKTQEEWKERLDYCCGRKVVAAVEEEPEPAPVVAAPSRGTEQYVQDRVELARQLARECLSGERVSTYQGWMEVGWCLHNIDESDEMFQVWMDVSAKSPKAGENNVSSLLRDWKRGWSRSSSERCFTIRSLHMWAKTDSPKRYRQIMNTSFVNFVESEVDATHTHIARLMKRMYEHSYCASVDSRKVEWYEFTGCYWKKLPQGIELRNKMTSDVADVIIEARRTIRDRLIQANMDHAFVESRMKKMIKIEQSLYQSGFKDAVMKDCVGIFYEEDFALKLNANPYLIGFTNGVLDLHAVRKKGSSGSSSSAAGGAGASAAAAEGANEFYVQFRKAEPSDFVTFLAGRYATKNCDPIEYIEYDPRDPEQARTHREIDDFMEKVFPRAELRQYMWRKLASCLEGSNKEQTYDTWIGVGGNGKSKLVDLMSMVLGDYASSLQSTAMTRKRPDSGAANPDIMAIRNKRFIYMAEPDDREPLNTSRMKQFTGEDDVEARGLFEDQTKFKITGKIFMLCNAFPAIHTMDRGTWRRVRATPFESKFVDPETEEIKPSENIYARDNELDAKLQRWRTLFMSRLVHIYRTEYLYHGLGKVPAIVTQESNKYQESFDSLAKFINARIREVKMGGHTAIMADLWLSYRSWFGENAGAGRKLTQTELYKRLSDKYGEPSDKRTFKQMIVFQSDAEIDAYEKELLEAKGSKEGKEGRMEITGLGLSNV
jgi:P4 family phage/plasmid primase-like protien